MFASIEKYDGARGDNIYLAESEATPNIPGLLGGAAAYGMLAVDARDLLKENFFDAAPGDAVMAVVRIDAGIPGLVDKFGGYDLVLVINLTDSAIATPKFGAGLLGYEQALREAGFLNDAVFGDGSDDVLAELAAHGVYATLIPEATQGFTASGGVSGVNYQGKALELADGQAMFVRPPGLVATVDQTLSPQFDANLAGSPYQSLGFVRVTADPTAEDGLKLEVFLNQSGAGLAAADGVLIRRVDPTLANLRVLDLQGNPLDNRANEIFIDQLESRIGDQVLMALEALPADGRLLADLELRIQAIDTAGSARTWIIVAVAAADTVANTSAAELGSQIEAAFAAGLSAAGFATGDWTLALVAGHLQLSVESGAGIAAVSLYGGAAIGFGDGQHIGTDVEFDANDAPRIASIDNQGTTPGALRFNGGSDAVVINNSASLAALNKTITLETWFRVDSFANDWMPVVQKGTGTSFNTRSVSLWVNELGYLHFTSADVNGFQSYANTPTGSIETGKWYHFAGVLDRNSGRMEVYLDGELVGIASNTVTNANTVSHTAALRFGQTLESSTAFSPFSGQLDSVRLWNSARSQAQIEQDMTRTLAAGSSGLVGDWRFGELTGNSVADASGNGNNGVLAGTVERLLAPLHVSVDDSRTDKVWLSAVSDDFRVRVRVDGNELVFTRLFNFEGTAHITLTAHDGSGAAGDSRGRTDTTGFDITFVDNAIYGVKWDDRDADGVRDGPRFGDGGFEAGEPGIDGIKLFLDANGNNILDPGERFTVSDANGDYAFRDLDPEPTVPATVLAASALATADLADGGTAETLLSSVFGNYYTGQGFVNVPLRRTDTYTVRDVKAQFTLNGAAIGEIRLRPAMVADNANINALVADVNLLLAQGGLSDRVVAMAAGTRFVFASVAAGNDVTLGVSTSQENRTESQVFTRSVQPFNVGGFSQINTASFSAAPQGDFSALAFNDFQSAIVLFRLTSFSLSSSSAVLGASTPGALGFAAAGQFAQGGDAAPRIVEIPSPGSAPTSGVEQDGLGPVGVRTVTFTAPGEISSDNDFGNLQVAVLDVRVSPPGPLLEGQLLRFTGTASESGTDDGPIISFLAGLGDEGPGRDGAPVYSLDWTLVDAIGQTIDTGSGARFSFVAPDEGSYTLYFGATDTLNRRQAYPLSVPLVIGNAAPVFDAGPDLAVDEGDVVSLAGADLSDAGADDVLTLVVDWGDGFVTEHGFDAAAGQAMADFLAGVTHQYGVEGSYAVSISVDDGDGGMALDGLTITVANVAPTLSEIPPYSADEGDPLELALPFFDPGFGEAYSATIDWGDGTSESLSIGVTETGRILLGAHAYGNEGEYSGVIRLQDDGGGMTEAAFSVVVANLAPEISTVRSTQYIAEGDTFSLDDVLLSVRDFGFLDALEVQVDWGDGSAPESGTVATAVYAAEGGWVYQEGPLSAAHRYNDNSASEGRFNITVRVSDGRVESERVIRLVVDNVAPKMDEIPALSVNQGAVLELLVPFTDPGTADTHEALVFWGDTFGEDGQSGEPAQVTYDSDGVGSISASHTFARPGSYFGFITLVDDDGDEHVREFRVEVLNAAPEVTAVADFAVREGEAFELTLADFVDLGVTDAFSAVIEWGDGSSTILESVDATAGAGTIVAGHVYDDNGKYKVLVSVTDDNGGSGSDALRITVDNVAPVLAPVARQFLVAGAGLSLALAATDVESDQVLFSIDSAPQGATVDPQTGVFQWTAPFGTSVATYDVTINAADEDGGVTPLSFTIEVDPDLLRVMAMTPTATGYDVRFNRAIDAERLNLYAAEGFDLGQADTTLREAANNRKVAGSIVLHGDHQGYTFIKTGNPRSNGLLGAGSFNLELESRVRGFTDLHGRQLDGDGDGVAGGNYRTSFVQVGGAVVLSLGEIARGPGQALNPAALSTGFPVRLSNAAGVTSVSFTLDYDPALLSISAVTGAVAGATVSSDLGTPGHLKVSISGLSGLGAAAVDLVRLVASVPATAPYGIKQVLDLGNIVVNNGSRPALDDDGLHVVAYAGDASGNAAYSTQDVQALQRVLLRLDSGFGAFPLVDPTVIGNVTGNGTLSSLDQRFLTQKVQGINQSVIPAIPELVQPITFNGWDPLVSVATRDALAGGMVTVPVMLDTAANLSSVQLRLVYSATDLTLVNVRVGSLTIDFNWLFKAEEPGRLTVDMSRLRALGGGSGSLLELDFRVSPQASGTLVLDLQWAALNDTRLTLNPAPQVGADATDGAIRVQPAPVVLTDGAAPDSAGAKPAAQAQWLAEWLGGQTGQVKKEASAWRVFLPRK